MATIEFRGAMLFVVRDGVISEVLFPDTERNPPGQHGSSKKHHDGSHAHPHYPGIVVHRRYGTEVAHGLKNARISFQGATVDLVDTEIAALPDVADQHPGLNLTVDPGASTSGSVSMKFFPGTTVTTPPPWQRFYVNGFSCPLWVSLKVQGALTIEVSSSAGPHQSIQVGPHDTAIIHHFDTANPSYKRLTSERTIPTGTNTFSDDDFKWLLALCTPRPGSAAWGTTPLATPVWNRGVGPSAPLVVSVSTCFPARIGR